MKKSLIIVSIFMISGIAFAIDPPNIAKTSTIELEFSGAGDPENNTYQNMVDSSDLSGWLTNDDVEYPYYINFVWENEIIFDQIMILHMDNNQYITSYTIEYMDYVTGRWIQIPGTFTVDRDHKTSTHSIDRVATTKIRMKALSGKSSASGLKEFYVHNNLALSSTSEVYFNNNTNSTGLSKVNDGATSDEYSFIFPSTSSLPSNLTFYFAQKGDINKITLYHHSLYYWTSFDIQIRDDSGSWTTSFSNQSAIAGGLPQTFLLDNNAFGVRFVVKESNNSTYTAINDVMIYNDTIKEYDLTLSPNVLNLTVGNSSTISAITASGHSNRYYYKSSNRSIASVSETTGLVTAISKGTATITVYGLLTGTTKTATVNVTDPVTPTPTTEPTPIPTTEPTPNPDDITLSITADKTTYSLNDTMDVSVTISGDEAVDVYIALVDPAGNFQTMKIDGSFSATNTAEAIVGNWTIYSDIYSLPQVLVSDTYMTGAYQWVVVITSAGSDPLDTSNWLKVATYDFNIQ